VAWLFFLSGSRIVIGIGLRIGETGKEMNDIERLEIERLRAENKLFRAALQAIAEDYKYKGDSGWRAFDIARRALGMDD